MRLILKQARAQKFQGLSTVLVGGGWNGWCYNLEIKKRYSLWKYISKRIHAITPEFQREATIEWGPI